MARPEAIAKFGYFALPEPAATWIAAYLHLPAEGNITLLDPCMGEGKALHDLALALNSKRVIPYGIELSTARWQTARARFVDPKTKRGSARFLNGASEFAQVTPESIAVLYLNPPFDDNGKEQVRWLNMARKWVIPGGLCIFVTTVSATERYDLSNDISHWWKVEGLYDLPEDIQQYHETVIFLRRREKSVQHYYDSGYDQNETLYYNYAQKRNRGTLMEDPGVRHSVLATPREVEKFTVQMPQLGDALERYALSNVSHLETWRDAMIPQSASSRQQPRHHIRDGHVADLIAAGMLDCLPIRDEELGRCIITGYGVKETSDPEHEEKDNGDEKWTFHEMPVIYLNVMNIDNGEISTFSTQEPEVMNTFILRHLETFRKAIERDFKPLFKPEKVLPKYLKTIVGFGSPKVLPGVTRVRLTDGRKATVQSVSKETQLPTSVLLDDGTVRAVATEDIDFTFRLLLPAQFITAATVADAWASGDKYAAMIAKMGSGKTGQSLAAVVMYLQDRLDAIMRGEDQAKIVVLMPGHLISKWIAEAKGVLRKFEEQYGVSVPVVNPGSIERYDRQYTTRNGRMVCNQCGAEHRMRFKTPEDLERRLQDRNIVTCDNCKGTMFVRFQNLYRDIDDVMKAPGLGIIVLSGETAKLGAPWRAAGIARMQYERTPLTRTLEVTPTVQCPHCGKVKTTKVSLNGETEVLPIDPEVFFKKRGTQFVCTETVERPTRNDQGEVLYKVHEVKVRRPACEMVQDIEYFINANDEKDQRPKVDENGEPVMVEYRPGVSYLGNSTPPDAEWVEEDVTIQLPARSDWNESTDSAHICGSPMFTMTRFGDNTKLPHANKAVTLRNGATFEVFVPTLIGKPGGNGSARSEVGKYIARKYKGQYILIADELHEYKSESSSRGNILALMANNSHKTVGLTGTIYNGKASGLFYLLHRLSPHFRSIFDWSAVSRFVAQFGVRDVIVTRKANVQQTVKGYGGRKYESRRVVEANGAMPNIVQWLLPIATFMDLKDLNIALPPMRSKFHWVDLDPEFATEMDALKRIREMAVAEAVKGDMSRLSAWIQAAVGWTMAPDQAETWQHPQHRRVCSEAEREAAALLEKGQVEEAQKLLDKADEYRQQTTETWLTAKQFTETWPAPSITLNVIREVKLAADTGEKSIVFVSGVKRPAAKSFYKLAVAAGLKPLVLTAPGDENIASWCAKEDYIACELEERGSRIMEVLSSKDYNVLICNPQLIATGLDLVMFNHVHLAGRPHQSVLIIAQAINRVYRPGQERDVTVHTWAYGADPRTNRSLDTNNIQAVAAMAMSQKLRALAIVNGDVGETLAAISERNDDITKILRDQILKDEMPEFTDMNEATFSPRLERNPALDRLRDLMERADEARARGEAIETVTEAEMAAILGIGLDQTAPAYDMEADTVEAPVAMLEAQVADEIDGVAEEPVAPQSADGRYRLMTADEWADLPQWRSQEDLGDDAVAVMKFYHPESGWAWYVLERQDEGDLLFGYVAGAAFELSSFSLNELEEARCVRDDAFQPTNVGTLKVMCGVVSEPVAAETAAPVVAPEPEVEEADIFVWPTDAQIVWSIRSAVVDKKVTSQLYELLAA